jgi:hypothetical protein
MRDYTVPMLSNSGRDGNQPTFESQMAIIEAIMGDTASFS